jgi:hypothetical protein
VWEVCSVRWKCEYRNCNI